METSANQNKRKKPKVGIVVGSGGMKALSSIALFDFIDKSKSEVIKTELEAIDAAVVVPLSSRKVLAGLIILDYKKSGQFFSAEDIELLSQTVKISKPLAGCFAIE